MKYIITEDQLEKVKDKILKVSFQALDDDWNALQEFLSRRGNPPYIITDDVYLSGDIEIKTFGSLISIEGDLHLGNLYLSSAQIESFGNLSSVGGDLDLRYTSIKSLGNLTSVGGNSLLINTPIKSLGNLKSVGGNLYLQNTRISRKYSEQKIRDMVKVGGEIYL